MELENKQSVVRSNNDMLDLMKFILSFFIVAIHTNLYPQILYPWLRIAVPLFFLISSYLLFMKLKDMDKREGWAAVNKTARRLALLYLFWFVILFPVTVYVRRGWFSEGLVSGLLNTVKGILFSSSFIGSWYITASIGAIYIIYGISSLRRKRSIILPLVIVTVVYLFCCLTSSYYFMIENKLGLVKFIASYEKLFASPVFSFPLAVFWMTLGKLLAEDRLKINKITSIIVLCLSAVLLFLEWKYVSLRTGQITYDCLLLLAPLAVSIFVLLKDVQVSIPQSKELRKMSTITYCSHASIALGVYGFFKLANLNVNPLLHFIITITICYIVSRIIFVLEKKNKFSFLRYSH